MFSFSFSFRFSFGYQKYLATSTSTANSCRPRSFCLNPRPKSTFETFAKIYFMFKIESQHLKKSWYCQVIIVNPNFKSKFKFKSQSKYSTFTFKVQSHIQIDIQVQLYVVLMSTASDLHTKSTPKVQGYVIMLCHSPAIAQPCPIKVNCLHTDVANWLYQY